jgi:hypothetical protein
MLDQSPDFILDRTSFSIADLTDEPDERAYWHSKTPAERLRAAEFLRQQLYGYDPATIRLQRVLEVVEVQWR